MIAEGAAAARRDRRRSAKIGAAAAAFYGSWALLANLGHGGGRALLAAGVQACLSFSMTFALTEAMHALERRLGTSPRARLLTALLPSLAADVLVAAAHALARTPEILRTMAPSILIGTLYATVYVTWRRSRSSLVQVDCRVSS